MAAPDFESAAEQAASSNPFEGVNEMAIESAGLHEQFVNFAGVGFSEAQAIYLCAAMLTGNPGLPPRF